MPENASPQRGDNYLKLNGRNAYVEIPSTADYSVRKTGELTVAAWMRPDTLNFSHVEKDTDYIHWLGKGAQSGANGDQEWTFRMYNYKDPVDHQERPNRISFYVFNPAGGLGVGSFVQTPIETGQWIHIVSVVDTARTHIYKDGQYIRCDTYRGPAQGHCEIHYQAPPNDKLQLVINPKVGSAPVRLGTKDLHSFLEGGLSRVRLWKRALDAAEILDLYANDTAPRHGLVAEFLLDADSGTIAVDTAKGNNGKLVQAVWAIQV
jgi:hypothetical protein